MSLIFSRQCEYAIQSLIYLAKKQDREWVSITEIASNLKIPKHFLGKILQSLSFTNIIKSQKGLHGGFSLAKNPKDISLFDIVEVVDGDAYRKKCVIGFPDCSNNNPCPVHTKWKDLRDSIVEMIKKKSLLDVASEVTKPGYE